MMEKFWNAALAISGLAGIGAFIFWSLYKNWLSLPIFSRLTANQTFIIMVIFLILTFLCTMFLIIAYLIKDRVKPAQKVLNGFSSGLKRWLENNYKKQLSENAFKYLDCLLESLSESKDASLKVLNKPKNRNNKGIIQILKLNMTTDKNFNLTIAEIYYLETNFAQSMQHCRKELELYPNNYEARILLATIYDHDANPLMAKKEIYNLIEDLESVGTNIELLAHAYLFGWHLDKDNLELLKKAKEIAEKYNLQGTYLRTLHELKLNDEQISVITNYSSDDKFWGRYHEAEKAYENSEYPTARMILQSLYKENMSEKNWLAAEYCNSKIIECYTKEGEFKQVIAHLKKGVELCSKSGCIPGLATNYFKLAESYINPENKEIFEPYAALEIWKQLKEIGIKINDKNILQLSEYKIDLINHGIAGMKNEENLQRRLDGIRSMIPDPSDKKKLSLLAQITRYAFSPVSNLYGFFRDTPLYKKYRKNYKKESSGAELEVFKILLKSATECKYQKIIKREDAINAVEKILSRSFEEEYLEAKSIMDELRIDISPMKLMQLMVELTDDEMKSATDWLSSFSDKHEDEKTRIGVEYLLAGVFGRNEKLPKGVAKKILRILSVQQ